MQEGDVYSCTQCGCEMTVTKAADKPQANMPPPACCGVTMQKK